MTLTLTLSPEAEERLRELAAQAGQTVEGYARHLVEGQVLGADGARPAAAPPGPTRDRTFAEIFAPVREEIRASGVTEEELEALIEQAREEVWRERQARQRP